MTAMHAARAVRLLKEFDEAGILSVADVQVAQRLGRLAGETDERVLLAAALTVRSTRHGSVVFDLAEAATTTAPDEEDADEVVDVAALPWPEVPQWVEACAASPLVIGGEGGAPLRIVGSRLWLTRYWVQEAQVARDLLTRGSDDPSDLDVSKLGADLDELFTADSDADQRQATFTAAMHRVSVIGGGPGTGKTTTIARLIAVLRRQRPQLRIALAAPTGKAAARLEEAVRSAAQSLREPDRAALASLTASTLHRLLGWKPGVTSRFRHDRENRLPYDVVIVDECSMVSLTMMARLLEALTPTTRLVLVGDPDQLASVEAGAVLGDLVDASADASVLRHSVALLRVVHRYDAAGAIAQLAQLVRDGRADDALALLHSAPDGIAFHTAPDDEPLAGAALGVVRAQTAHELAVVAAARAGDVGGALDALDRHRVLCAHHGGPRGVRYWSDAFERWLAADDPLMLPRLDGRYAGQPLLVTSNDYENGLYNGDTGVVVERDAELVAAFRRGGEPVVLPLVRLGDVRPLHAMTVHRAQGSQFAEVTVLLPPAGSPLATRQTFYTAITRATTLVRVIGSDEAVLASVNRPAARASGLRDRLCGGFVVGA
jgi:exodeoxyribonuclease V alpha subunit